MAQRSGGGLHASHARAYWGWVLGARDLARVTRDAASSGSIPVGPYLPAFLMLLATRLPFDCRPPQNRRPQDVRRH
jgi:hypothetical protein